MELRNFILQKLQETELKLPRGYSIEDVINLLIHGSTVAGWPSGTRTRFIKNIPQLNSLEKGSTYKNRFVKFYNKFHCTKCDNVLPLEQAVKGRFNICVPCDNFRCKVYRENNQEKCKESAKSHYNSNKSYYFARNAKARAAKLNATPKWSNDVNILAFYEECPAGSHVDHVIPLQGLLVSGLHVEENLQYLTATDNISKSNKVDLELESETQLTICRSKMKLYYNNTHIV